MKILTFLILFFNLSSAFAQSSLTTILTKYQKSLVGMEVTYETDSLLLQKTTTQSGKITLFKNKFQWVFDEPADKKIIFDGKTLIHLEKVDNLVMVTKKKIDNPKQLVWFQLFSNPNKVKIVSYDKKTKTYEVLLDKYKVRLKVNNQELTEVYYFDELDSKITLKINKTNFKEKTKPDFKFTPTGNEQITEL